MRREWGGKEVVWDGWPEFAQAPSVGCLDSRESGRKLPRFVVGSCAGLEWEAVQVPNERRMRLA